MSIESSNSPVREQTPSPSERQREEDFAILDRIREKFAHISVEEHEREVARAVQEARLELRAEREAADSPEDSASS